MGIAFAARDLRSNMFPSAQRDSANESGCLSRFAPSSAKRWALFFHFLFISIRNIRYNCQTSWFMASAQVFRQDIINHLTAFGIPSTPAQQRPIYPKRFNWAAREERTCSKRCYSYMIMAISSPYIRLMVGLLGRIAFETTRLRFRVHGQRNNNSAADEPEKTQKSIKFSYRTASRNCWGSLCSMALEILRHQLYLSFAVDSFRDCIQLRN